MHPVKIVFLKNIWSHASTSRQADLIQEFVKENGRENIDQDRWWLFLADRFSLEDSQIGVIED